MQFNTMGRMIYVVVYIYIYGVLRQKYACTLQLLILATHVWLNHIHLTVGAPLFSNDIQIKNVTEIRLHFNSYISSCCKINVPNTFIAKQWQKTSNCKCIRAY